ncbi:MAG: ParB/RepB/Spo0J family partition protein [Clostridia bacterium]|nr:ParB/RepB/Spo0J family partition protein [Clostridia bacterium]
MPKEKKASGFLNIISRMNETVNPVNVIVSPPMKEIKQEHNETPGGVREISINLIDVNPEQPRKQFDEIALNELSSSIKEHGIIQPIIVTKKEGKFVIVAGERRYRAAKLAGLSKLPVIVRDISERERREFALIENLQREGLNPIEEAEAMRALIEEYNLTQEELSQSLGKSRPAVANTLRLLKLPAEIIDMVRCGKLTQGHARALLALKAGELQIKYAKEVIIKKISVHELELRINKLLLNKITTRVPYKLSLELRAIENDMQRVFATKVKIMGNEARGKIQIEYFSKEELQKIYEVLEEIKADI